MVLLRPAATQICLGSPALALQCPFSPQLRPGTLETGYFLALFSLKVRSLIVGPRRKLSVIWSWMEMRATSRGPNDACRAVPTPQASREHCRPLTTRDVSPCGAPVSQSVRERPAWAAAGSASRARALASGTGVHMGPEAGSHLRAPIAARRSRRQGAPRKHPLCQDFSHFCARWRNCPPAPQHTAPRNPAHAEPTCSRWQPPCSGRTRHRAC